MGDFWQDVRYGLRMQAKSPGVTAIAILTLALGVGANTAVFSDVNALTLRPLPAKDPEQLVTLSAQQMDRSLLEGFSYPDFLEIRNQTDALSDLIAYEIGLVGLNADRRSDRLLVSYVTGNYFQMLGVRAARGRLILPTEGQTPGADSLLVLGYSYWKKRFSGDPGVIGKQVLINGHLTAIVGVVAKEFHGVYPLVETQGYLPLSMAAIEPDSTGMWTDRNERDLMLLGRLKPGTGVKQAQASLNVIAARLAQQYPNTDQGITIRVDPERLARPQLEANTPMPVNKADILFLLLSGLVLLLACVNVANILLVRTVARQEEMAIRAALGADRRRLIRQLLTESEILAVIGGGFGILLGKWVSHLLGSLQLPMDIPYRLDFSFDWSVFAYTFIAICLAGFIVGVLSAHRAVSFEIGPVLHGSSYRLSDDGGRQGMRNVLVMAQVAGSLMLLVIAGLFTRSLQKAQRMDLGFNANHVVNFRMDPREIGDDEIQGREFYRELESRVRGLPGIESTGLAYSIPLDYYYDAGKVFIEGRPLSSGEQAPEVVYDMVSPGYFRTLRIPILRGRAFTDLDDQGAPRVAVINETMAHLFWPDEEPLRKRFRRGSASGPWTEVIGIVKDCKYLSADEKSRPYFYVPLAQDYSSLQTLEVRSALPSEMTVAAVQQAIHQLAPGLPIFDVRSMKDAIQGVNGFFLLRLRAIFASTLGILGMVLAIVGVYGVVSYTATKRTREIGVRLALGAQPFDILTMILRQGLGVVGLGLIGGLFAAFVVSRMIADFLVGVSSTDPLIYSGVSALLSVVALVACYIPALRAMSVDPMVILRRE